MAAAAVATTGLVAATPSTANAGAYGCAGNLVRSWTLKNGLEIPMSRVRLYYNPRTGYNCAVNVWLPTAGLKSKIAVSIRSSTDRKAKADSGSYNSYAGPVKTYGKNRCVKVYGYASASNYAAHYTSGWVACG